MKPIGRVIFEAADRSANYPFVWDATLALALLPGGACTVRQDGQAFALQGTPTPPNYTDPPVVMTVDPSPALAALKAAVAAMPQATDQNAAFAALKVAVGAVSTAVVKQDPTPALTAIQAKLAGPGPGTLGTVDLRQADGKGGTLEFRWRRGDPADVPPTLIYNGDKLTLTEVLAFTPA